MSEDLRHKMSRVYELCIRLWPVDFQDKYAEKDRSVFNEWLNEKTDSCCSNSESSD